MENKRKIVVALTGSTGSIYGIRLLNALKEADHVETHLVMSSWAEKNIELETPYKAPDIQKLAHFVHDNNNLGAPIASGSFLTESMVIIPCSMKTLSAVACGYADNLISRTADVMLKERRTLLLAVRETPFNLIHLNNMTAARPGYHPYDEEDLLRRLYS